MSEYLFLGTGPGQTAQTKIGDVVYERFQRYTDVPEDHVRRGGFFAADEPPVEPAPAESPEGCIVLGSAPCWEEDLAAARELVPDWPVVAVNGIGALYLDDIAVWVSIHGKDLLKWVPLREERGGNMDYAGYGNFDKATEPPHGFVAWNRPNSGGSSGLHAVECALEIGYERVILCGVPLDGQERCRSLDGTPVEGVTKYSAYHNGWESKFSLLEERVRSMSGWTKKLLGAPTRGWLK